MAHETMKTRRKFLPDQPGTKQLVKLYGNRLVCIRYRYDREQHRKIKTVELIVDEAEWENYTLWRYLTSMYRQ